MTYLDRYRDITVTFELRLVISVKNCSDLESRWVLKGKTNGQDKSKKATVNEK